MADAEAQARPTAEHADRFPDRSVALPALEACGRRRRRDADSWTSTRRAALFEGYELKLNSYDLGVDIELADAIERLRFEHPRGEGRPAALRQAARVLRRRQHPHAGGRDPRPQGQLLQVHQRDPQRHRGRQRSLRPEVPSASINGTAAGGGYELALAADHIMLVDDGSSTVSLPELPLLAVLPGTGGLTRVTDKRKVRRDHADVFCTTEEGVKGKRAVDWRLVDEVVPSSKLDEAVHERAQGIRREVRPAGRRQGHRARRRSSATRTADGVEYSAVSVEFDARRAARHHHAARAGCAPPQSADDDGRRRAPRSGRCGSRASSTTRSSTSAPQRARHRRDRVQVGGRSRAGARLRRVPRRQQGALAGARDPCTTGSACSSAST